MERIDASKLLDYTVSNTTATLLAKKWDSALLVNVEDNVLKRIMNNEDALNALQKIEGFRAINEDLEILINKSEHIKNVKKKANEKDLTKKEKKELTKEEKEKRKLKKEIQQNLRKIATRIPIFMYLTDYREESLKDVITQFEPGLFKKVTGLTVKDFELLISFGVFNESLMNTAIFDFKRYEDASLEYTGINKHEGEEIGLYDTVLSPEEYEDSFVNEPG